METYSNKLAYLLDSVIDLCAYMTNDTKDITYDEWDACMEHIWKIANITGTDKALEIIRGRS